MNAPDGRARRGTVAGAALAILVALTTLAALVARSTRHPREGVSRTTAQDPT
ncbi:hypothetical protein [Streptomyces sp. MW-W600-10]|uniref:hypothetical protein n=1 Tax=Streptomyces sp. MW-W600-10 TaxID=2829819 RepID=UPI001C4767EF|nr:hypothetical protein [Streptomyces sp. MW-W600-10]MBV7243679.1 hypothetical protein [Streptomyces sp. MW-W600-10]